MSKKKKILIADDVGTRAFNKFAKVKYEIIDNPGLSNEDILPMDIDALVIRSTRKISREFVDVFRGNVIATFTKGTDHIDKNACKAKGIKIISANEGNSQSAAEHTLALMLAAVKNLDHSDKLVRSGRFEDIKFERSELFKKKMGVIGYGTIGKRVAKLCKAFGMDVYVCESDPKVRKRYRKVTFKSLNYILRHCDIVSIHIPLEKNVNFISREKLSILKKGSIIVNTSRGGIIDEDYMIELLKAKEIKFAGIDVFKSEPNINSLFFGLDNVILSNHIAGKTSESKERIAEEVTDKLYKYLQKKK